MRRCGNRRAHEESDKKGAGFLLKKATGKEAEEYKEAAYRLALDPLLSSNPTYADGIKTKEDFSRDAAAAAF